jgi:hypothetical protein
MSTVLTPTKAVAVTALISTQSLASNTVFKGTEVDVSTKWGAGIYLYLGRTVATALTAAFKYRIELSYKASGDNAWIEAYEVASNIAACNDEAVSGTVAAGQNAIGVSSLTGFAAGDKIFVKNSTFANSEWHQVKSTETAPTPDTVTVVDNLVNAATGGTIYDDAQWWFIPVDVSMAARLRVIADGSGTGQAVGVRAEVAYFNSVTGT